MSELAGTPDVERLAEALAEHAPQRTLIWARRFAAALLPAVDAIKREAQAEALEKAATAGELIPTGEPASYRRMVGTGWLHDAAAALRAGTDR